MITTIHHNIPRDKDITGTQYLFNDAMKWIHILVAPLIIASCAPIREPANNYLTAYELNARPGFYDGKLVQAVGWLDYGFERRGLTAIDPKRNKALVSAATEDCVGIQMSRILIDKAKRLDARKVIVSGTFHASLIGSGLNFSLCNTAGIRVVSLAPFRD